MAFLLPSSATPGAPLVSIGNGSLYTPGEFPETTSRTSRTYAVQGLIAVPSGATNFLPGFHVSVPNEMRLVSIVGQVRAGSCTLEVQQNGSNVTGLTSLSIGTSLSGPFYPTNPTLIADNDYLAIVIQTITSTPDGLSLTFNFDEVTTT